MANFTIEIREMMDNPLINGVFTFDYDFYGNEEEKQHFEKLFIQHYYFNEIGFETTERFKYHLKAKLDLIAPYYKQLYQTEWVNLKSVEQMMTSKNLIETSEHTQLIEGSNETESNATSTNHQSDTIEQSSTSTGTSNTTSLGTSNTTSTTDDKQSNLADGVAQATLTDGYLTSVGNSTNQTDGESSNTTDVTLSSGDTSNTTNTIQGTSEQNGTSSGSNRQQLTETTTFTSKGDIGVQTPAYAITEWRKVLININQLMIDECKDLFMKIY